MNLAIYSGNLAALSALSLSSSDLLNSWNFNLHPYIQVDGVRRSDAIYFPGGIRRTSGFCSIIHYMLLSPMGCPNSLPNRPYGYGWCLGILIPRPWYHDQHSRGHYGCSVWKPKILGKNAVLKVNPKGRDQGGRFFLGKSMKTRCFWCKYRV